MRAGRIEVHTVGVGIHASVMSIAVRKRMTHTACTLDKDSAGAVTLQ